MPDVAQDQMDNQNPTAETAASGGRTVVPKGQRLPQASFEEVRPVVVALGALNGAASEKLVAGQAKMSAGGGAWKRRWAAIGFYGFREETGDGRHAISERGRAFISDDSAAVLDAMQHAVVSTGFRRILDRFSTSNVNEIAIGGVLAEDFGVPEDKTKKIAAYLVDVSTEAGMISDNRFQVAPIEQAMEAIAEVTVTAMKKPAKGKATPRAPRPVAPAATRTTQRTTPATKPVAERIEVVSDSGPFAVTVEIKIDAKDHTPAQIGAIVRNVKDALSTAA